MRIVLHAGSHKTGTTSIQNALSANRDWLAEHGIAYPDLGGAGKSHNKLTRRIAEASKRELREIRLELLRASEGQETLVLSAEEIWASTHRQSDWARMTRRGYRSERRAFLARLHGVLAPLGTIEVHVCLRRPDQFAHSLYATKVMSSRFLGSFAEFRSAAAPIFDYPSQIAMLEEEVGPVRWISFDALKERLVANFCSWTGLPVVPVTDFRDRPSADPAIVFWLDVRGREDSMGVRARRAEFASEARAGIPARAHASLWNSQEERDEFLARLPSMDCAGFPLPGPLPALGPAEFEAEFPALDTAFDGWLSGKGLLEPPKEPSFLQKARLRLKQTFSSSA